MLTHQTILITGASSGLGKELAINCAAYAANIILIGRNEKALQSVAQICEEKGSHAKYYLCDLSQKEQIEKTIAQILDRFGRIDVLINNAGIWTTDELENHKPELIEEAFRINSIAPIYITKLILPCMISANSGHILNIISKAGKNIPDNKDWPTYSATKWALAGYTEAIRFATQNTKVRVSAFYPGGFESNIFETAGEKDSHNQPWMMPTEAVASGVMYMLTRSEDILIQSLEMSRR